MAALELPHTDKNANWISKRLNISLGIVLESLSRLEQAGLVQKQNGGWEVKASGRQLERVSGSIDQMIEQKINFIASNNHHKDFARTKNVGGLLWRIGPRKQQAPLYVFSYDPSRPSESLGATGQRKMASTELRTTSHFNLGSLLPNLFQPAISDQQLKEMPDLVSVSFLNPKFDFQNGTILLNKKATSTLAPVYDLIVRYKGQRKTRCAYSQ